MPVFRSRRTRQRAIRIGVYTTSLAVVALVIAKADWAAVGDAYFNWEIFQDQFPDIVRRAAKNTIIFTFFAFTGGLAIGLFMALLRLSSIRPYRWFASFYIEIFRGIPALVTLLLIGYAMPITLGIKIPGTYGPGSLALAIVAGAYMAESIRAGIEAVPPGQMEAARSLGMGYGRAMASIVVPQAFRIMIPPLTNELVLLVKDTSLIYVLGTTQETEEITKFARNNAADTFNGTPLIAAALVYLAITIPLTFLARYTEKRAKRGNR